LALTREMSRKKRAISTFWWNSKKPIGLKFVELADYLEDLLNIKVDLLSKGAVKPKMLKYVMEDLAYV